MRKEKRGLRDLAAIHLEHVGLRCPQLGGEGDTGADLLLLGEKVSQATEEAMCYLGSWTLVPG